MLTRNAALSVMKDRSLEVEGVLASESLTAAPVLEGRTPLGSIRVAPKVGIRMPLHPVESLPCDDFPR
jgi:hypothetical protein